MSTFHRITFPHLASDGHVFVPGAFARSIGGQIRVTFAWSPERETAGTLVGAVVADDGRSVLLTMDVDDDQ